jgi:23S rRNA-/tRNA-specific pseudouridylate synthase
MRRRFVVGEADHGLTLSDVIARVGGDASAISDGRVFVRSHRISDPAHRLSVGDDVSVADSESNRVAAEVVSLGHSAGFVAFAKPPGLPTIPDHRGNASLLHAAAAYLGVSPSELHVLTRLDVNVSGVVLLALGREATRRAVLLQSSGGVVRRYVGLSAGVPEPPCGVWTDPVGARVSGRGRLRRPVRDAATRYAVRSIVSGKSDRSRTALLVFEPVTGRTHQIRIHSSAGGAPLLGDVAYGGPKRLVAENGSVLDVARVSLHAARVDVVLGSEASLSFEAKPPEDLVSLWTRLGGTRADFDTATSPLELDAARAAWKVRPNGL